MTAVHIIIKREREETTSGTQSGLKAGPRQEPQETKLWDTNPQMTGIDRTGIDLGAGMISQRVPPIETGLYLLRA